MADAGIHDVLAGWRDSGADRADPVRFRLIEAMARRAAAHDGAARRLLDRRLAELVAAYGKGLARADDAWRAGPAHDALKEGPSGDALKEGPAGDALKAGAPDHALKAAARDTAGLPAPMPEAPGPLAQLVARLAARPGAQALPGAPAVASATPNTAPPAPTPDIALPASRAPVPARATPPATPAAAPPEPALADYFRNTWTRVSVGSQMRQSQERVPENAGPLNSSQLVHRTLSLMQETAPGYLEQFLSYVEALSWLEGLEAPRAARAQKKR